MKLTKEVLEVYQEWTKNNAAEDAMFLLDLLLLAIDNTLLKYVFDFTT